MAYHNDGDGGVDEIQGGVDAVLQRDSWADSWSSNTKHPAK
jgi:hypothetical protein